MTYFLLLLTIIAPLFSIPFIFIGLFCENIRYKKYIVFLLSIVLGIILYHIIPNEEMDLYRYYLKMNEFTQNELGIRSEIIEKSDFIAYGFMYILAIIGNKNLLPFISIVLVYNIYFHVIEKISCLYKINKKQINKVILYMLSIIIIISTATSYRYGIAICLFLYGFYIDFIKKDKSLKKYIVYFLALGFHITTAILLFIVLVIKHFKNNTPKIIYLILALILILPKVIIKIFSLISKISFLEELSIKLGYYLVFYIPFDSIWYLIRMGAFILGIILLLKNQKYKEDEKIGTTIQLLNFLAIISILTIPYYFISIRFIYIFNIYIMVLMIFNIAENKNTKLINFIITYVVIFFGTFQLNMFYITDFGNLGLNKMFYNIFSLFNLGG